MSSSELCWCGHRKHQHASGNDECSAPRCACVKFSESPCQDVTAATIKMMRLTAERIEAEEPEELGGTQQCCWCGREYRGAGAPGFVRGYCREQCKVSGETLAELVKRTRDLEGRFRRLELRVLALERAADKKPAWQRAMTALFGGLWSKDHEC